ncbi:MAG: right-handed parallel beta-helix repeat-containing protein [bacterium]
MSQREFISIKCFILRRENILRFRLFLVIIIIFGCLLRANAATYYVVDGIGESCNDSNSGTASAPWCNCPGMEDWSGSAILNPGDIVYFESDGTWNHNNTNSDHFFWIDGGVQYIGDEWGDGTRAKFTMDTSFSCPPAGNNHMIIAWFEDDANYETVFQGFELDFQEECATGIGMNFASGSAWDPRAQGDLTGAIKRIENCYIHNHYNTNNWNYPIIVQTGPYNLTGWNSSNIEILNNIITDTARDAICLYPANDSDHIDNFISNVTIRGNDISFINCTSEPCGSNRKDGGGYPAGSGFMMKNHSDNVIVEFNSVKNTYGSGFVANSEIGVGYAESATNHIWRYNILENCNNQGVKIKSLGDKSIDFYGNIIINAGGSGVNVGMERLGDDLEMKIYNNTFYEDSGTPLTVQSNEAKITTLEVINNIFYAANGSPLIDEDGDITTHNNNIYYRASAGNLVLAPGGPYTSSNLTTYEENALSNDPLFKNILNQPSGFTGTYGIDMKPDADGLNISVGSPGKDSGMLLDSLYSNSINGIARPHGNSWDIGAYEVYFSTGSPDPPLNLRMTNCSECN